MSQESSSKKIKLSSESPQKKVKAALMDVASFTQMRNLKPNKAYKIYKIVDTDHGEYGPGKKAYIIEGSKKKFHVQLPKKWLNTLLERVPTAIDDYIQAIRRSQHPFLVYRRTNTDGSYEMDVLDYDEEVNSCYKMGTDVPELDISGGGTPPPSPESDVQTTATLDTSPAKETVPDSKN